MPPTPGVGEQHPCYAPTCLISTLPSRSRNRWPGGDGKGRTGLCQQPGSLRDTAGSSVFSSFVLLLPGVYFSLLRGCTYVAYHGGLRGRTGNEGPVPAAVGKPGLPLAHSGGLAPGRLLPQPQGHEHGPGAGE